MGDKLTFYLLRQLNFITDSPAKWLGRIVKEYSSPLANSIPSDPTPFFPSSASLHSTVIADATTLLKSSSSTKFKSVLANVLGGGYENEGTQESRIETKRLTRWRIRDDEEVLARVLSDPIVKERITRWVKEGMMGKPVYFIVGVLSASSLTSTHTTSTSHTLSGSVDVPIINIATAAAGVPLPIDLGGVSLEKDKKRGMAYEMQGVSEGEQIFALEYKMLKRKVFSVSGRIVDRGYGPTFESEDGGVQETIGRSTKRKPTTNTQPVVERIESRVEEIKMPEPQIRESQPEVRIITSTGKVVLTGPVGPPVNPSSQPGGGSSTGGRPTGPDYSPAPPAYSPTSPASPAFSPTSPRYSPTNPDAKFAPPTSAATTPHGDQEHTPMPMAINLDDNFIDDNSNNNVIPATCLPSDDDPTWNMPGAFPLIIPRMRIGVSQTSDLVLPPLDDEADEDNYEDDADEAENLNASTDSGEEDHSSDVNDQYHGLQYGDEAIQQMEEFYIDEEHTFIQRVQTDGLGDVGEGELLGEDGEGMTFVFEDEDEDGTIGLTEVEPEGLERMRI